jgi:hypothetical protein
MDLNKEVWDVIEATPKIPDEIKRSLHVKIMRLFEQARATPVGKKHGVTIMTQEASLAGDKVAQDRHADINPGEAKPKNL